MPFDSATREAMLESVDRLIRDRVAPRAKELDDSSTFPHDLYREAAKLGLFGLWTPEAYGGLAGDMRTALLIAERFARVSPTFALIFANCGDATIPLVMAASERVKREWLPGIASGEIVPCFALTEPKGGSDAAAITTRARRDGDGYVLDGRKMWITNGTVGGVYLVFAKTDPEAGGRGVSAFVVPRGAPGFSIGREESLIGLHGSPVCELIFEGVPVPADARVGAEGEGFKIAMLTLDEARLNAAAISLGIARASIECAIGYAKERVQFGVPIIEHQGLQFLIAELLTEYHAAKALWEKTVDMVEREQTREASAYCAMTK
ncbi:MAG: acyl-CoA dehydrogenase family protein, partial [Alphaproteobacteria bacterium]